MSRSTMADTSVPQTDDFAPDCQDRRHDDCRAEWCVCTCHIDDQPGSIQDDQGDVLIGMLMARSLIGEGTRAARAELITTVIPGWQYGSDLGPLSQAQALDLIEYLGQPDD